MNESSTSTNESQEQSWSPDEELGGSMTFLEHLTELRERLIYCLISLVVGFVIMFNISDHLVEFIRATIPENVELQVFYPAEGLMTLIRVSMYAGIFVAFPFIFYQIWMFVAPGLYRHEKRIFLPLILGSWFCFILGGVFCYVFVFKIVLQFLSDITPQLVIEEWSLTEYITFTVRFILAFALVFQEPVILLFLARIGIVNTKMLIKFFPYAMIGMFTISALITPPDPFSQLMCAFPLIFLYGVSIFIVRITEKKVAEVEEEP